MLTMKYLQPALVPIVKDKISSMHDETVSQFGRQLCAEATAKDIEKCDGNMAKFKHRCATEQKYTYACQTLLNIIKSHTSDSVDLFEMLQGTDPQKWIKTPLEFVRLFLKNWMRCGIEEFKDCDISALCNIIKRCKPLMQMFDYEKISAVKRVRNKTMHCAQMDLSQEDMEEHIEIILDFLNHMKSLKNTDDVTKAIDCIKQLRAGDVSFLHELVVELITGCLPGARQEYLHRHAMANKLHQSISYMEKELDRLSSGVENAESIHKGSEAVLEAKANIQGKPSAIRVFSDSVDVVWDGVRNFSKGDAYQVHIENTQTGQWDTRIFEKNRGKIRDLEQGATYVLKVRLVKANGEESKYSENSEEFTTKKETKQKTDRPGKPNVKEIYTDSVDIVWNSVQLFQKQDRYQVRLETVPEGKWELQDYETSNVKVTGLKPNTSYLFKVRWVKFNGEESTYSEESDIITTTVPFASKILGESKLVKKDSGELDVYQLPLNELLNARNEAANSKKFEIGQRYMDAINEKTIMLVGATGSGKSRFVDLIANYVLGVRLDDPFRFTVTKEGDRANQRDKGQSQTDVIACYSFNKQAGTRLKYGINVIDTPGFGDVRGPERDQKTVEQIRQLFEATGIKGIQTIDAVCFFIKTPEARLTEAQRIFKEVLSMFSQDIKENLCAITTFNDGREPKVFAALQAEKIYFDNIFNFNNSALFSNPRKNSLTSMFWNMGFHGLDELFSHINKLKPKCLQLSKEGLVEKHQPVPTYQEKTI